MITVTFPDGAERQFEPGTTGFDIAKSIAVGILKGTGIDLINDSLTPPIFIFRKRHYLLNCAL